MGESPPSWPVVLGRWGWPVAVAPVVLGGPCRAAAGSTAGVQRRRRGLRER
ncbi:MAG: hypothetical protein ABSH36_12525 [Solirubrobacteraceae bacterium]